MATAFLVLMLLPLYIAFAAMWEGYALSVLWGWFVVPMFGLPALSIPFAMGLALVVGLLTSHRLGNEATDDSKQWRMVWVAVMRPAMVLLIGWIVTKFL
jgi:hypothetical protein